MSDHSKHEATPAEPADGGCQLGGDGACPLTYTDEKRSRNRRAKDAIGRFVAGELLTESGQAVLLDAGSTVEAVAKHIFAREKGPGQVGGEATRADRPERACLNLTIMTNNMGIWRHFNVDGPGSDAAGDDAQDALPADHSLALLLTGGKYDRQHDALFGSLAKKGIEAFNPHVVVIGTSGFTFDRGGGLYYHGHTEEEVVKAAMWGKETEHRIVVCDHTKIGRRDSFLGGGIDVLHKGARECTVVTTSWKFEDPAPDSRLAAHYDDVYREQRSHFEELRKEIQRKSPRYPLKLVRLLPPTDGSAMYITEKA